ncbi:hypothetical protein JCM10908_001529 [Rhodotorula pacifica]|uniref:uncharacterized protein n=1 Tax=Rhodotorula pacifica TaxID=1495444 RepID=UPI00316C5548
MSDFNTHGDPAYSRPRTPSRGQQPYRPPPPPPLSTSGWSASYRPAYAPSGLTATPTSSAYHQPHDRDHHQFEYAEPPRYDNGRRPSFPYVSSFSAYRDDLTSIPPSPTTPSTYGSSRSRDAGGSRPSSAFSSPDSWEQWSPTQPMHSAMQSTTTSSPWHPSLDVFSTHQPPHARNEPPHQDSGMRTPPPTGRVPAAAGGFPAQPNGLSPQVWPQQWSANEGEQSSSRRSSLSGPQLPPSLLPTQRTRYSIAGVILDEDDFIDYATSSLDWADSVGEEPGQPSRLDTETSKGTKAFSPTFYTQLLSPLELDRPASAPPEKRRPRSLATGHSGVIEQDGDVFYQITNRRRSSSVDATMARTATAKAALPIEEMPHDVAAEAYERPPRPPPAHRGSFRGWIHYERRASMASLDEPNMAVQYHSSAPYPPQRPVTPTRSKRPQTPRSASSSTAANHTGPLTPHRVPTRNDPTTPSPSPRRPAARPSSLSFVNFSSADSAKLMKAVSRSGGTGKHKRTSS